VYQLLIALVWLTKRAIFMVTFEMSKHDLKYQIDKLLDEFSEDALENLLAFLKQVKAKNNRTLFDAAHLSKVLAEDKELLEKLAQ
jgi:hypothetical protein